MTNPYEKYQVKSVMISFTQRKFMNALQRLMKKGKSHYEISVSELCKEASLSRPTFYDNYHNIGEIVDDMQNEFLLDGSTRSAKFYTPSVDSADEIPFLQNFMVYMLKKKEDYFYFVKGPNGPDNRFIEKWKNIIKFRFFKFYCDRNDYDFILEVISSAIVNGLIYFVDNPEKYSQKQFQESILHMYKVITTKY